MDRVGLFGPLPGRTQRAAWQRGAVASLIQDSRDQTGEERLVRAHIKILK